MEYFFLLFALYIATFLISTLFFKQIFEPKKSTAVTIAIGAAFYLISFGQFCLFNNFILTAVVFFASNFLYLLCAFNCAVKKSLLYALLTGTFAVISYEIVDMLSYILTDENSTQVMLYFLILGALFVFLYLILLQISAYALKRIFKVNENNVPFYFFIFPISSTVIIAMLLELVPMVQLSGKLYLLLIGAVITIIFSVILTYVFFEKYSEREQQLLLISSQKKESELSQKYYEVIDTQNEVLKQFVHDEKNHLQAIANLDSMEQVQSYVKKLHGSIESFSYYGKTDNKLLDMILGKYNILCNNKKINFTINIKTSNFSYLQEDDLTSLFSNILDNAVEAAESSFEKRIEISANNINGFDVITCSNSCDTAPNENLSSRKKDHQLHGNGMKIIQRISKKYNGEVQWNYNDENKEFILKIVFIK
ncbi:MAG: sensor histidine kinase [Acutalibacteraceae bacterium]